MEQLPSPSKYQVLHERGVKLDDEKIDFIVELMTMGIKDVYDYLEIDEKERTLGFISSENLDRIGYALDQKAINIPIAYLNSLAEANKQLEHISVALKFIQESSEEIPFAAWLRNAGREETVHYFQHLGNLKLHASVPDGEKYMHASELERVLCDYEAEARAVVDKIAEQLGENPIWKELDDFLKKNYPERYNKPLT